MKFNKIYNSTESLEVNFLPFNRPVSQYHAKNLRDSILRHGWIGTAIMIHTDLFSKKPKLYVLDGQHRITGAIMADVRFRYEVKQVTNLEEVVILMADLNNNSKGWFLEDYLGPWTFLGQRNYKKLSEVFQRTKIPLAALIKLYSGTSYSGEMGGQTTNKFKRGAFVMKNEQVAEEIIAEVLELQRKIGTFNRAFVLGFADFYLGNKKKYTRTHMLESLLKHKKEIKLISSSLDVKNLLVEIYKKR